MRYIRENAKDCPADLFINLYKNANKPPKKVTFSRKAFEFFKDHADLIVIHGRVAKFGWDAIENENLPELRVKVAKKRKWL